MTSVATQRRAPVQAEQRYGHIVVSGDACVEIALPRRAVVRRFRRWSLRRKSTRIMANLSWRARFWYAVHTRFNYVCFGEGYGASDWGHNHRSVMAAHRWLCCRWTPEWDAYLATQRPAHD